MGYAIINSVPQVKITSNRREQFLFFFLTYIIIYLIYFLRISYIYVMYLDQIYPDSFPSNSSPIFLTTFPF